MSLKEEIARKPTHELKTILVRPPAPLDALLKLRIEEELERRSKQSNDEKPHD